MNSVSPSENIVKTTLLGDGRFRHLSAQLISAISMPPVTGTLALFLCAYLANRSDFWGRTAVYALIVIGLPVLFVFMLYQQGIVSDLDLSRRQERFWPYATFAVCSLLGYGFLLTVQAPTLLVLFSIIVIMQATAGFLITTQWKISVHCYSAANLTVLLLILFGRTAVPMVIVLLLIAWSRIYLNRHTPAQTFAGILLGGMTTAVILTLGG